MASRVVVSHRNTRDFKGGGLRSFFQYRDLGIRDATKGKIGAHVIRATPSRGKNGGHAKRIKGSDAHQHTLDFQMVYVLKGWVEFEYEGYGRVRLKPGTSVYQPPGIRHREIAHSSDLELIEITAPAEFETADAAMPKKRRKR